MFGAFVIFVGACVAMYVPIYNLIEAKTALHVEERRGGYDAEHLRGASGDYAIVEGQGYKRSFFFCARGFCPRVIIIFLMSFV